MYSQKSTQSNCLLADLKENSQLFILNLWNKYDNNSICKGALSEKKKSVYMHLTFVQSCGRTLPLHANQPGQPTLPCAHDNPWPGKWGQSLAFGQEPRPWGPEGGRAWQQDGIWDLLDEAVSNKGGSTLHILFTILDINIKQNNAEAQVWPLLCYCREHCKSLWMICLRPCSALCVGAPPCPWQSSICLISWTSRPTDTTSTTWVFVTPGRAIGEKERVHFPSKCYYNNFT